MQLEKCSVEGCLISNESLGYEVEDVGDQATLQPGKIGLNFNSFSKVFPAHKCTTDKTNVSKIFFRNIWAKKDLHLV